MMSTNEMETEASAVLAQILLFWSKEPSDEHGIQDEMQRISDDLRERLGLEAMVVILRSVKLALFKLADFGPPAFRDERGKDTVH